MLMLAFFQILYGCRFSFLLGCYPTVGKKPPILEWLLLMVCLDTQFVDFHWLTLKLPVLNHCIVIDLNFCHSLGNIYGRLEVESLVCEITEFNISEACFLRF